MHHPILAGATLPTAHAFDQPPVDLPNQALGYRPAIAQVAADKLERVAKQLADIVGIGLGDCLTLIVIPKLRDENRVALDLIDNPVLVIDAPRPVAREGVFQWLRLAEPAERLSLNVSDESVDPRQDLPVDPLPVQVLLPGLLRAN